MTSPPTTQPAADAGQYQAAQAGLALVLAQSLTALWPSLDLGDLAGSLPRFKAGVAAIIMRHAQMSGALAVQQYSAQRRAAGVTAGYRPTMVDPPRLQQISETVDWATQPLWNPNVLREARPPEVPEQMPLPGMPEPSLRPEEPFPEHEDPFQYDEEPPHVLEPEAPSAQEATAKAEQRLNSAAERLVLDTGRDTIVNNVQKDKHATAWARVPEPGACSFCLMLASRGAAYKSERSADFQTHDNCRCHVEPVFTSYEPSQAVRDAQKLWAEATQGKSGRDARIAFRQAVEGRTAPQS